MAAMADNDNVVAPTAGAPMRIYVFTSKTKKDLRAFTDDRSGGKLPRQFGPWHAKGTVATGQELPYRFPRDQVEKSIAGSGFQLWRLKPKKNEEKAD
jgi:hypothetical protein